MTRKGISKKFEGLEFSEVPSRTGIFKMSAKHLIKNTTDTSEREKLSLKYQVLSPETAFVGVIKKEGEQEELLEIYLNQKQETIQLPEARPRVYHRMARRSAPRYYSSMRQPLSMAAAQPMAMAMAPMAMAMPVPVRT